MPIKDDAALQAQVLDELLEFASRGQGLEARQRLGKPLPPGLEAKPEEAMAEGEEPIPGMDAPEDVGAEGEGDLGGVAMEGDAEEELDPELLKAALASLGG